MSQPPDDGPPAAYEPEHPLPIAEPDAPCVDSPCADSDPDGPLPSETAPPELVDEPAGLAPWQFGLGAMFSLTTACGVYFAIERATGGGFGLAALGGAALALFGALPLLWVTTYLARSVMDAPEPLSTILMVLIIAGGVLAILLYTWQ